MRSLARSILSTMAVLIFASVLAAQAPEPSTEARNTLNMGVSAFRNANYAAAVAYFKRAVELDPSWTTAEIYLATAYAQQFVPGVQSRENREMADNAIDTFKRVLSRDPNNINALSGLASIYQNTNDHQNARETYLALSRLDPQNPVAFYALGSIDWIIVYDRENPQPLGVQSALIEEGLNNLDIALSLNPDYDDAMTYKNLLFREKARLAVDPAERARFTALADEWFNKALDTRKKNAQARQVGSTGGRTLVGPAPPPPPPPPRAPQR